MARFVILLLGARNGDGDGLSALRARRRSLNGDSECVVGGDGSWFGVVSIDCRARHVENIVVAVLVCGDRGGDARRPLDV